MVRGRYYLFALAQILASVLLGALILGGLGLIVAGVDGVLNGIVLGGAVGLVGGIMITGLSGVAYGSKIAEWWGRHMRS